MPTFNALSLFSGIGGIDLAFNWAGGNILAFCEIDCYCQKVLRKHWPDVPIFSDIHKLNREVIENAGISTAVDVIYGGFPCQPFSVAGDKKGKDDTRYLWPEFSRLVAELRPRWVVAENVPGILRIAADDVCSDLERQDYDVGIFDFEAAAVGAKHRRERIFFVAHSRRSLLQRCVEQGTLQDETQERTSYQPERPSCSPAAYSDGKRREKQRKPVKIESTFAGFERGFGRLSQSRVCRGFDGLSPFLDGTLSLTATGIKNRTNRLKALGNAVVPQQIFPIFLAIKECDDFEQEQP